MNLPIKYEDNALGIRFNFRSSTKQFLWALFFYIFQWKSLTSPVITLKNNHFCQDYYIEKVSLIHVSPIFSTVIGFGWKW